MTDLINRAAAQHYGWISGEPPKPWRDEWFIAKTIHGDKVVLRSLPEEWSYDYTTADHTYMISANIVCWMQFPDSDFIMPAAIPSATDTDALRAAEDRGIAIGLRAAAAWASDEANKCDDAAKWGGHRTYVANCKAAAYALRNAVLKIGGIKTAEARKIGGGE